MPGPSVLHRPVVSEAPARASTANATAGILPSRRHAAWETPAALAQEFWDDLPTVTLAEVIPELYETTQVESHARTPLASAAAALR